ncbi:MAG: hypothetical protein KGO49_09825 [Gammaproteobacteria bacterium]|nr:hypothetical protein [Gammaproteobacteria bacterium]
MDFVQIEDWLKTTIAGIVLLGAFGSIVAVWLLKYLGPPAQKLFSKPLRYLQKERMWRYWRSGTAYSFIKNDQTNRKLIFYLFRHLARLLMALTALAVSIIALSISVTSRSDVLLTYGTFFLATAAFLSSYWVKIEYDYITINYVVEWQGTGLVKDIPNLKAGKDKTTPNPSFKRDA